MTIESSGILKNDCLVILTYYRYLYVIIFNADDDFIAAYAFKFVSCIQKRAYEHNDQIPKEKK